MRVELVAPDREVWAGDATMVIARTTEGDIGILPGHEAVLGLLVESPVTIHREGAPDLVAAVHGGFLSVTTAGVSVLAEMVELAEEIDADRARRALGRAHEDDDPQAKAAARRATARLRVLGEHG